MLAAKTFEEKEECAWYGKEAFWRAYLGKKELPYLIDVVSRELYTCKALLWKVISKYYCTRRIS